MRISVCMATCNGERYLPAQLDSILAQLGPEDELIIADDASEDGTRALIEALDEPRITLLAGRERRGHVARFAEALQAAGGDILMLADQDDIWSPGRVEALQDALCSPDILLVAGQFEQIDGEGQPLPPPPRQLRAADSRRPLANILGILLGRRPYYGCAMACRRTLLPLVLPIPRRTESHDLWLALAANLAGGIRHLERTLLHKRQHGGNLSSPRPRPWPIRLRSRWWMLWQLWELRRRLRRYDARRISQGRTD